MNEPEPDSVPFYVAGGTLRPGAPSYVVRKADAELYERLLAGTFCYVLTARQLGKSSLMARTARRLEEDGICTVTVDLTSIGGEKTSLTAESWYYGVVNELHQKLQITQTLRSWWTAQEGIPSLQKLSLYLRNVVLENCSKRIVIFVDEIDSTIRLPFADDFFAAIRFCHNARARDAAYERLTFALFGVASPDQLIRDPERTPFNIGYRIDLTDLDLPEARILAQGLHADSVWSALLLERIFYWTGGHPYLTQTICQAAVEQKEEPPPAKPEIAIDPLVGDLFLSSRAQDETNLKQTRERLLQQGGEKRSRLNLYLRVLQGKPVADEPTDPLLSQLKLSGIIKLTKDSRFDVRNRIYEKVFSAAWVKSKLPPNPIRRVAVGMLVLGVLLGVGAWWVFTSQKLNSFQEAIYADDFYNAKRLYDEIRDDAFLQDDAAHLMAEFWDHRALRYAAAEKRDETLLARLKAISYLDTPGRRKEAQHLVGYDYLALEHTIRMTEGARFALSLDARKLLVIVERERQAQMFSLPDGQLVDESSPHKDEIITASFSPTGRLILTGSLDRTAQLWDSQNGSPFASPLANEFSVTAIASSPDERTVLIGSSDGTAQLRHATDGSPFGPPLRHEDRIGAEAFSPDGRLVVTASWDGTAQLWSSDSGRPIGPPLRHESGIDAVAFSPDGRRVLTGSWDGTARLWRTDNGLAATAAPLRHGAGIKALAFSPDGRTVITSAWDGTSRLWSADKGMPITLLPARVTEAEPPLELNYLIVGREGMVRYMRGGNGSLRPPFPLRHEDSVDAVAFDPSGHGIVTASADGTIRFWSIEDEKRLQLQYEQRLESIAINPDGSQLLLHARGSTGVHIGRFWRTDDGHRVGKTLMHEAQVLSASFSHDGQFVFTHDVDNTSRVWDAGSGQVLAELNSSGQLESRLFGLLRKENSPRFIDVVLGPDRQRLLAIDEEKNVQIINRAKRAESLLPHESVVGSAEFSPNGRLALTIDEIGLMRLWDTENAQLVGKKPMKLASSGGKALFSPHGENVLSLVGPSGIGGSAELWRVSDQKLLDRSPTFRNFIYDMRFTPSGDSILFSSERWMHFYSVSKGRFEHVSSRRLEVRSDAIAIPTSCKVCAEIVVVLGGNLVEIRRVNLLEPDDAPGEKRVAKELLDEWQRRLGLRFDDKMDLVPWNVPPSRALEKRFQ